MNKVLRVELTEEERRDLDKYLINFPFGQISYILRHAVREFIRVEKDKAERVIIAGVLAQREAQSGNQSHQGRRPKKT